MTKYNRPNGKLFGSSATNIGRFGSGQAGETYTTTTDPNVANTLGTHWEQGWDGAVVSQAPYTAPFIEDMNAVNYVNSYNSAYLLQRGIPEYSATEEYQTDSVCTYNGEIYICMADGTVGVTPDESAPEWHLQAELPVMSDNEILVGDTGNGATVTDTLNQGDILASTSGLDIKAGVVTNTHISSQAGDKIAESKLDLAYTTSTLNTNIGNVSNDLNTHTTDYNNPHSTTLANLVGNNLSTPSTDDTLVYDGVNSEWINLPNTLDNIKNITITSVAQGDTLNYDGSKWVNTENSLDNLTDTTITSANSGDALTYNGSKWVNTENSVDNLTNTTITSANSGDALVYDGSDWINQENSLNNLTDTALLNPASGDALVYDGSDWINQENSVDNLTNTTITSATSGDALVYDGSDWINQENSLINLTDTTIVTPSDGEALLYDGNTSKWVNSALTGGALSTLTDVNLTTPLADGEVLLYDSSATKWVNSPVIEVYEIANINTATTDITITASDKRHQMLTATDGFNITLPSTGVRAGETFIFEWTNSFGTDITNPFTFYTGDNVSYKLAHINNFYYYFTALQDNPTSSSHWLFDYKLKQRYDTGGSGNATYGSSDGTSFSKNTPVILTLKKGIYDISMNVGWGIVESSIEAGICNNSNTNTILDHVSSISSKSTAQNFNTISPKGGNVNSGNSFFRSHIKASLTSKSNALYGRITLVLPSALGSNATSTFNLSAKLSDPITS